MQERSAATSFAISAIALFLAAGAGSNAAPAGPVRPTGDTWTSVMKEGELVVELSRSPGPGRSWTSSFTLPADFPVRTGATGARFLAIRRDAGAFELTGTVHDDGSGSGVFRFTPDAAFVEELRSLGYHPGGADQAFRLAVFGLSREFILSMRTLGYEDVDLEGLIEMRLRGVDPSFTTAMNDLLGLRLAPAELIDLRINGVTPGWAGALVDLDYDGLSAAQLKALRIHGVTAELVRGFQGLGYRDLEPDQLIELNVHGVTPEFASEVILTEGQPLPRPEQLIRRRIAIPSTGVN